MSSGALAIVGLHPNPVGTLDELRQQKLDPGAYGSCAPGPGLPGHEKGVRGCAFWDKCIFRFSRHGGFRGELDDPEKPQMGPRNIGYYVKTHEGSQMEYTMACFRFMATMAHRMGASIRDRESGYPNAEVVEIVSHEPEIAALMRAAGHKTDTKVRERVMSRNEKDAKVWDTGGVGNWDRRTETKDVPAFPRPGQTPTELDYDTELYQRHLERNTDNLELKTGLPSARPERIEDGADDKEESDVIDFGAAPESMGKK